MVKFRSAIHILFIYFIFVAFLYTYKETLQKWLNYSLKVVLKIMTLLNTCLSYCKKHYYSSLSIISHNQYYLAIYKIFCFTKLLYSFKQICNAVHNCKV